MNWNWLQKLEVLKDYKNKSENELIKMLSKPESKIKHSKQKIWEIWKMKKRSEKNLMNYGIAFLSQK